MTLAALTGRRLSDYDRNRMWNWAMHWGQGMLLGAVRGAMARRGLRGPVGSFLFLNLRLLNDQTLENATGGWITAVDLASRRAGDRSDREGGLCLRHRSDR